LRVIKGWQGKPSQTSLTQIKEWLSAQGMSTPIEMRSIADRALGKGSRTCSRPQQGPSKATRSRRWSRRTPAQRR
jgi:hypothetical protein